MVTIKTDDRAWKKEWQRITKKAIPQAIAATLTGLADDAKAYAVQNLKSDFTLRNAYTANSIKALKARPNPQISRINAVTGSVSEYLPRQEEGATVRARKRAIAIPTKWARKGMKKTGIVQPRHRMPSMGVLNVPNGKYFAANMGRKLGIYFRDKKRGKAVMVRDLSARSYVLKPRRWLARAVTRAASYERVVKYYHDAMRKLKAGTLV